MKKVLQNDIYDCGICSLKAIINYYHADVPLEVLRYDTFTDCGGTDMYHLLTASKKYGFDGYGMMANVDELNNVPKPLIVHTLVNKNYEHFMVLEKISNNYYYLMDPARGNIKLKKTEFNDIYTGKALVLYPISKIISIKERKSLFKFIKDLILNEKQILINLTIITIFLTSLSILYSLLFKVFLSNKLAYNKPLYLNCTLLFFGILLFMLMFNFLKDYYQSYLSKNVDAYIKDTFIKHIFYLPSYSIKSRNAGEILTRLNELNNYKSLLTDYIVNIGLDLITVLITGILLFLINKYLFLILVITLILYLLVGLLFNNYIKKAIDDVLNKESEFNTNLVENIENLDSLKFLHLEKNNYNTNQTLNAHMLYANFKFELNIHKITLLKNIIHEGGLLLINLIGIYLIYHNYMSLIDLITFNAIIIYFKDPIKNYIDLLPKISYVASSYQKLSEFFQIDEETFNNQSSLLSNGDIKFRNVSITYDGINNVISNETFIIKKNSKCFMRGRSGSGKSSLCKALYRLNDHYTGDIMINNINIKDLDLSVIRSNVGYLGQKEGLFTDTIYNNIVMNRPVDNLEFNRITKICELDDILKNKPLRYQTMVLEGGKNLSGGEKARILLARILLKYPDILILDEALSELNINLERQILFNLTSYLNNRTLIYISHRYLDNYFDQVITLNEC